MKTLIIVALLAFAGIVFSKQITNVFSPTQEDKKQKKNKKGKAGTPGRASFGSDIKVKQKWDLPADLVEVSGIAFIDDERFACVQDEQGIIYIYNTAKGKIEKQIPFTGTGDFEGLTITNKYAYVVRADGIIYEVDMASNKSSQYNTGLNIKNNVEGLSYDHKGNRLLLVGKGTDGRYPGYKAIYAFDLASKKMVGEPLYKIALADLRVKKSAKRDIEIMPSAIAVHPITDELYITDATKSILVTLDKSANVKKIYQLGNDFTQAEGITFSPAGDIFISNEGKKQAGNIMHVTLK